MAARATKKTQERQLLARLERRLGLLADTLDAAPVADKGLDVVRELKEVHALLRALGDGAEHTRAEPPRLVVVWADTPPKAE
ncbi:MULTISPECIES: hypothetical protein [unclassified Desulfovibrio]|uniref:hypothetical protein n=1 Tax=unclassified Desulfovibrio TaxID=2593640 RepID=UPI0013EAFE9F|nr:MULTISPECIES: hypothetical protein [unclassified Desulfovibrio]